jgi:hypothetical protein
MNEKCGAKDQGECEKPDLLVGHHRKDSPVLIFKRSGAAEAAPLKFSTAIRFTDR